MPVIYNTLLLLLLLMLCLIILLYLIILINWLFVVYKYFNYVSDWSYNTVYIIIILL